MSGFSARPGAGDGGRRDVAATQLWRSHNRPQLVVFGWSMSVSRDPSTPALCTIRRVASEDPWVGLISDHEEGRAREDSRDRLLDGAVLAPITAGSKRSVAASAIRHVLFDADGVLQIVPGGLYAAREPYLGDRAREFLHQAWKDELPTLAGEGDYLPMLAATLVEYGVTEPVDVFCRDVWHRIERIEESFAVVEALRRNGYGVHLGTNQEHHRGGHMRTVLGYDDVFDISCYSYDLGVAKPDPAFFTEAARRIGARRRRSCSSTTASGTSRARWWQASSPWSGTSNRVTTPWSDCSQVMESTLG